MEAARESDGVSVAASVARREAAFPAGAPPVCTDLAEALGLAPEAVVIDAAPGEGVAGRVRTVAGAGRPLVLASTGLDAAAERELEEAARRIPVVVAPNLSPGILLLGRALRAVLAVRGPRWDISILDRHHRHKRDAPSGTARALSELVARSSPDGSEPPVVSLRQGEVVGEHTVFLAGAGEELVFRHRATSRRVFAEGALLAARFAAEAAPGRFSMEDVLGRE
jgi:4-hydroxy-tetrahydrodipicolinate reductase